MQKDLDDFVGCKFYNDRVDKKLDNVDEIKRILEDFKQRKQLRDFKVKRVDTKDGVKLYFDDDTSWMLVRPSGTEPLLRIYFESDSLAKLDELRKTI